MENTSDLGGLVVTHLRGMAQGTRRITAVTGPAALQVGACVGVVEIYTITLLAAFIHNADDRA